MPPILPFNPDSQIDTIVLGGSRALILPHKPKLLTLDQVSNKLKQAPVEVQRLGLFDSGSADYAKFYPEVTPDDFVPKPEDYVEPLVRALSEVIVHKDWNPIDFSKKGVLKASLPLLVGQSVMVDHDTATGSILGVVPETAWQESYKSKEGLLVPAGINAILRLDGKSNTDLIRKLQMDPPAVHSVSVTVMFEWEPSHSFKDQGEFYAKLGTFDENGEMYRRIVTRIKCYKEISLVTHGADPYAQIIRDGQINNPQYADITYNAEDGKGTQVKYHLTDYKIDCLEDMVSNSENPSIPTNTNNNPPNTRSQNMNPILLMLAAAFALSTDGKDEAALTAELTPLVSAQLAKNQSDATALVQAKASIQSLTDELAQKTTALTEAQSQLASSPGLAQFGEKAQTKMRDRCLSLYATLNSNATEGPMVDLIKNGDYNFLSVMLAQFEEQQEKAFPLSCKSCGSHEVSRGSAKLADPKENPTGDVPKLSLLQRKLAEANSNKAKAMHGDK